jgi:hypothetical protein
MNDLEFERSMNTTKTYLALLLQKKALLQSLSELETRLEVFRAATNYGGE